MNRAAQTLRAERDFWSTLSGELRPASPMRSLDAARSTQHALDAAVGLRIPVGEATELDLSDLMPYERKALPDAVAAFCRAFDDTVTGELI